MKSWRLPFFYFLPLLAFLAACTSRPALRLEEPVHEAPPENFPKDLPFPEETYSAMDLAIQRVKRNGGDIKKYFLLDGDYHIIIKADIPGPDGSGDGAEFEAVYDLENALPLEGSQLTVDFLVEEKSTGLQRKDKLIWSAGEDSAGILLAFDDNYEAAWENYFDLFDSYGAKITFFVQGEGPFCAEALRRGHDIGFHTLNHPELRKVSQEVFLAETLAPVDGFRQSGVPLSSFAYPFGFSEPWMHEFLSDSFGILRGYGTTFRIYNEEAIKAGYISSRAIDNTVIKDDEVFDRYVALMFRVVKFLGGDSILPLTTHDISDTALWGISPRRLEYILKTARDLNLKFYRYSDFAK
jgi:peptidoglycan/xylan/chitin deacetylase (PgdA/CDA1 family)